MQSLVRSEKYSDLDLPVGEALKSRPDVRRMIVQIDRELTWKKIELSRRLHLHNEWYPSLHIQSNTQKTSVSSCRDWAIHIQTDWIIEYIRYTRLSCQALIIIINTVHMYNLLCSLYHLSLQLSSWAYVCVILVKWVWGYLLIVQAVLYVNDGYRQVSSKSS